MASAASFSRRFVFAEFSCTARRRRLVCPYVHARCGWEGTMKILVLWHTGTRNRSTFRMLLSTSAVEKRATAMLGEEQWISVNIHAKDIETVRQRAIDALAMGYLNMGLLDGAKWPEPRITTPGPGSASCDLMIDLGEVVMS